MPNIKQLRRLIIKVNSRFQPKACDGCHDLMQKATNFDNIATGSEKDTFKYLLEYKDNDDTKP